MRLAAILTICFLMGSCLAKMESVSGPDAPIVDLPPPASPGPPLKPVELGLSLDKKQKKFLNESLPEDVREILEKSERFEILAEVHADETRVSDSRDFNPNRIAKISTAQQKKEILRAFYLDAATDEPPAVCYEPHHSIRASYQGKVADIEICFSCSRFVVTSLPDRPEGTLVRDGRRSEDLFAKIVEEAGVEIVK